MSKKKQATKPEKQTEKKRPAELKDEQLDSVQGGVTGRSFTNGALGKVTLLEDDPTGLSVSGDAPSAVPNTEKLHLCTVDIAVN